MPSSPIPGLPEPPRGGKGRLFNSFLSQGNCNFPPFVICLHFALAPESRIGKEEMFSDFFSSFVFWKSHFFQIRERTA